MHKHPFSSKHNTLINCRGIVNRKSPEGSVDQTPHIFSEKEGWLDQNSLEHTPRIDDFY